MTSLKVLRELYRLILVRSALSIIRVDIGPEFISHILQQWSNEHKIMLQYIQPGRQNKNSYIERKNGCMRREIFNTYLFSSLAEVRIMAEEWRTNYDEERPHKTHFAWILIILSEEVKRVVLSII